MEFEGLRYLPVHERRQFLAPESLSKIGRRIQSSSRIAAILILMNTPKFGHHSTSPDVVVTKMMYGTEERRKFLRAEWSGPDRYS